MVRNEAIRNIMPQGCFEVLSPYWIQEMHGYGFKSSLLFSIFSIERSKFKMVEDYFLAYNVLFFLTK